MPDTDRQTVCADTSIHSYMYVTNLIHTDIEFFGQVFTKLVELVACVHGPPLVVTPSFAVLYKSS